MDAASAAEGNHLVAEEGGHHLAVVVVGVGLCNGCVDLMSSSPMTPSGFSRLGAHIKRVIGLLYETRQTFTPEQINQNCYVIMLANKAVFDSLMNNAKVYYMRGVPNDFKPQVEVDDEFKSMLQDIDIPSNLLDVEKELFKICL
ncbi:hypothetical protein Bca52824_073370 [Brassica carinata]|uniref:Uncharacterized protein n=1 Tax=Brassica carinata TaxID=52824 RepID=A0A8X7Q9Q5_BRACI|nr:hypothetical protein Bca52824_073370 [Brassica carinata]